MKSALIGFRTANLGDDLQSIAVALALPFVDRLIDRDRLATLRLAEPHLLVMNAWFSKERFLPPSRAVEPIFHGFCLGRDEMRHGLWPRWLRARPGPIGCRDRGSIERLGRVGVAGAWTGCLTLTLGGRLAPVEPQDREGVVFIDVPPEAEALVPDAIRARAIRLSNAVPPAIAADPIARMAHVARTIDRLRRAELVVTKRLHAALPAVGCGTPVVVLVPERKGNRHRFSGYEDLFPLRFVDGDGRAEPIDWSGIVPNAMPDAVAAAVAVLGGKIEAALGPAPARTYPDLAWSRRLRVPNPGLGAEPGRVLIDLGMARVERPPRLWTDRFVDFDLDGFAGLERFRLPVLLADPSGRRVASAARLDAALAVPP